MGKIKYKVDDEIKLKDTGAYSELPTAQQKDLILLIKEYCNGNFFVYDRYVYRRYQFHLSWPANKYLAY